MNKAGAGNRAGFSFLDMRATGMCPASQIIERPSQSLDAERLLPRSPDFFVETIRLRLHFCRKFWLLRLLPFPASLFSRGIFT
jgi:hypothetical protein